ncbi:MAG: BrnT family toxin [Rhizobiaceae bacterium]
MELEWDEAKRQDALRERGLDFADVVRFRFEQQYTIQDNRTEYGEPRFVSTGYLDGRLCVLCWTFRDDKMRIISLRKANEREQKKYQDTSL